MDQFSDILTKNPVVIDNGSGEIKAGFAGEEQPTAVFSNYIGRPKHKKVIPTTSDAELYIGDEADKYKGLLKLKYPMSHGAVENWNDMETVWKSVYSRLKTTPKEHPVLLTEAPINSHSHRVQMAKIFFENLNSPAIFIAVQAVLSLYATGKSTGVVLDSGDGVTHTIPVVEGYSIQQAASRIDLGGRDVTEHLQLLLRKSGYGFYTSAEMEIVKKIKEKSCSLSEYALDDRSTDDRKKFKTPYLLPDGSVIDLSYERIRAPEIMFSPEKIGLELPGVHELLVNTIKKCDLDLRKTLYGEVVLAGGNTLLNNFPERFINETRKIAPKDVKIKIYAPNERKLSCWVGGSILSALGGFKKMWITKKEFEEEGERILLMKSF